MLRYVFDRNKKTRQPDQTYHLHDDMRPVFPYQRREEIHQTLDSHPVLEQAQYLFCFALPLELRAQVYKHALSGHDLILRSHLVWIQSGRHLAKSTGRRYTRRDKVDKPIRCEYYRLKGDSRNPGQLLALPLTCWKLYDECSKVICEENLFLVSSRFYPYQTSRILATMPYLLPKYMVASLRQLQITLSLPYCLLECEQCMSFFDKTWNALKAFGNLRKLRILLNVNLAFERSEDLAAWLNKRLGQVDHVDDLQLYLPKSYSWLEPQLTRSEQRFSIYVKGFTSHSMWPCFDETQLDYIG